MARLGSIRTKVWICVIVAFIGYLVATLSSFYSNQQLSSNLNQLRDIHLPLLLESIEAMSLFKKQSKLYEYGFTAGEEDYARQAGAITADITADLNMIISIMDHQEAHLDSGDIDLRRVRKVFTNYAASAREIYPRLSKGENFAPFKEKIQQLAKDRTELLQTFEKMADGFVMSYENKIEAEKNA